MTRDGWGRPTVLGDIAEPAVMMNPAMRVLDLDEWFRRNPQAASVVVRACPSGAGSLVLDRGWFERWINGRLGFGRAVHSRTTLARLATEVPTVLLPAGTEIAEAGAVVTDELGSSHGVSTIGALMPDGEVMTVSVTTLFRSLSRDFAFQARHDPLTGLPNRTSLAEWSGEPDEVTVLYVDLDRFKDVNDGLGHAAGDQVLREFADRLRRLARAGDRVVRLGGDEFALLLSGVLTPGQAQAVADRIVHEAALPFAVTVDHGAGEAVDSLVTIGASVGVAGVEAVPQIGGPLLPELVSRADLAMVRSKAKGRGRVTQFDPGLLARRARHHLERRLREAVREARLTLAYQPLAGVLSGRIVGAEALARWDDEELGPVSPVEFITVAEETGLIVDLGRWVLRTACFEAASWPSGGGGDRLKVSVNVSALQIAQPSFFREVLQALTDSGLPASCLCLELTETAVIGDMRSTAQLLREIRDLGVSIALDDFGTGFSSLTMLRDLPADLVKIDKSFVDKVTDETSADSVLTRLVVSTAHSLGMRVVAEGVETAEQAGLLGSMGCDVLQGWLIAKPQPDLAGWLHSRAGATAGE
ncbi:bifunctional diguanylate cyclase/phosphodiesterase [Kineosporia sp. J2-2]|uniref:Bifunctional diguanylate cyclase/phosphodiesterase n=1 Tax=Kineosporia corallincola TaxID=2835133 RepID=A0ABS5TIM4_9ACTN|nr:bifunctional diguanylate cyclase/phosphodiesterase [Kineosporia corallincola]MBT0770940.1 bifunctional diguanylate cyclase/phosphodiesterase [Kineosporia corallincola]